MIQTIVEFLSWWPENFCLSDKYTANTKKYKDTQIEIQIKTKEKIEMKIQFWRALPDAIGRQVGRSKKVVEQLPCYLSPLRAACIHLHTEYKYKYHSEYKYKYDSE